MQIKCQKIIINKSLKILYNFSEGFIIDPTLRSYLPKIGNIFPLYGA